MTIVGTVTRTAVSNIAEAQQGNANAGAFVARNGPTNLGFFPSVAAAKAAVNGRGGRPLRWERSDLRGGIEHYVAHDSQPGPLEFLGDDLALWTEVEDNARVLNAATGRVDLLGDKSGNSYSFTQTDPDLQGLLVASAINERSAIRLLVDRGDQMTSEVPLEPPFSFIVVANYIGGAAISNLMLSDGASPWRVGVDARGQWEYSNSLGTSISGGTANATPAMLTVRQDTAWGELRINRASVGGNGNNPSAATQVSLGLAGATPVPAGAWTGLFATLLFMYTTNNNLVEEAERWVRKRYNTP